MECRSGILWDGRVKHLMAEQLQVRYDERDFLEAWLPAYESEKPSTRFESGVYECFDDCARRRGAMRAFDSIMVDAFSRRYHEIIEEVRAKEPEVSDRYDVPEFDLYDVPLGDVLEYVYQHLVPALTGITTRVVGHAVPLPSAIEYMTDLTDETEVQVRVIDRNTMQLTRVSS